MQYSRDKARYFSARFHVSVAGAGTADRDLMRLTVSRCETDLENIKSAYQTVYGESLRSVVSVSIFKDIMGKKLQKLTAESLSFIFHDRAILLDPTNQLY